MMDRVVKAGAVVALNMLEDAVWFDVLEVNGHLLTVRQQGSSVKQTIDVCMVKQVKLESLISPDDLINSAVQELTRRGWTPGDIGAYLIKKGWERVAESPQVASALGR